MRYVNSPSLALRASQEGSNGATRVTHPLANNAPSPRSIGSPERQRRGMAADAMHIANQGVQTALSTPIIQPGVASMELPR